MLVCNHASFVMDHRIFRIPVLSFVFRTGRSIPIAPAKEGEALQANVLALRGDWR